uniref:ATP-binding protein n=1 Tax=mine drainage metagenome TaxID=410659 RepID=E6QPW0_9ZZZZ
MARQKKNAAGFGSLFEEDYLLRTLGRIAHDPDVALTELVANAWDAGASLVDITIPSEKQNTLVVTDDGHGMSTAQFKERWMTLAYDRVKHQGSNVEFPSERKDLRRRAYGRNGVGRHGLLCFSDCYEVETWREGKGTQFVVSTHNQQTPFIIERESTFQRNGHGSQLSVVVERHIPDADHIREIISARFLHDPQFVVRVNGQSISLPEHSGLIEHAVLPITDTLNVEAFVVDSTKAARSTLYQGIAFWVNNRLVGTPGWIVGNTAILDGRARFAKQYAIVVRAGAEWIPEVEEDWARFKTTDAVTALNEAVCSYALKMFEKLSANFVEESSEDALIRNREQFKELSTLGRIEVASFTQSLVKQHPTINSETLAIAVQAVINLEKSRSGAALLEKLTQLDESDIVGLDRLLGQWSVRDALSVLDEIDHRLAVIVAIEKLCGDSNTDELHTLHPLVTQARWLFGPEFDSHEYASNVTLRTAAEKIFGQKTITSFHNARQRPDLVVLADATYSIVGTEVFDSYDQNLTKIQDVLIIELKKGKSAIGRDEMNQADGYVQDFLGSGAMDGTPMFRAYVVGYEIHPKTSKEKEIKEDGVLRGRVVATTYGQLTRSAHQRFFKLKEKIPTRYDGVAGVDLMTKVMQTPTQDSFAL